MEIVNKKRWNSTGNEFEEQLEKRSIDYKIIFDDLKAFEAVTPGIAGGRHFKIFEYVRKNKQRVLAANGGFGIGDYVIEEVYLIQLDGDEEVEEKKVAELLREYIKKEEGLKND